jgi:nitrogen-specific signal transduction histidine kinase/CheY-like chemotaxis protein
MGAEFDLCGRRKDGTEFPVEVALNPIHLGDELVVLGVIVDISERKRIQRLKDEFVSTVSHELRTPLTSISGSLGLLVGNLAGDLPEPARRLLQIAFKNSQRLARLINDILDIEKIESGAVAFIPKRIEVAAVIEQAIEANRGFAETYCVSLRFAAGGAPLYVRADSDRLIQAITNLLSNAIKFSPPEGEVVIVVENHGDAVRISVRDNGPGIPADFQAHIFEKFAQADSSDTRAKGGTGLGLSIARGIVLRLGGELSFDTSLAGTAFYIDLPRFTSLPGESSRPLILHVEDDPDVRAAVAQALGSIADVVSVDSLTEAHCAIASNHFDLAILDIALPAGSGIDLLPALRNGDGDIIPVVIFSAGNEYVECDAQVQASVTKSLTSMDGLMATVRDRLSPDCKELG